MNLQAQMMPNNIHAFMQFDPEGPFFNKRSAAMYTIMEKQFICSRRPDWAPLEQAGIADDIRGLLTQQFYRDDGTLRHEYGDWVKLFNLWAPIYRELCFEFFATLEMNKKIQRADDNSFLEFRLGGVERRMSLLDMAACLGIYTASEQRASYFSEYLLEGDRVKESYDRDIWGRISETPYETSGNHVTDITRMDLRVIHRFLAHSITARGENSEKVTFMDMWYLNKILNRDSVSIPYCVAWFLMKKGSGRTGRSPICGGHFVTFIARSFNIDVAGLSVVFDPQERVEKIMYQKVRAISHNGRTFVPFHEPEGEPPRQRQRTGEGTSGVQAEAAEEEQAYDQGGFRVASPPPQHTYGAAHPDYLDVMHRLDDFQLQQDYRLGRIEYQSDWQHHNANLFYANPTNYQPTPQQNIPHWGQQSEGYTLPVYDPSAALEEAQRLHQLQQQQREQEQRYHEEQRGREQGGGWSPYDWFPF